ncbi:RnfH family protein [Noviherbaspirillum sp.]|uniref:RnfH family protein n=1 Tax=Noviherbaspirillum sp. TaxID=1926288 RepID=UPI002FE12F2B
MAEAAEIRVQVCYATPARQILRELQVVEGATLHVAIRQSGMLDEASEIDLSVLHVGVFGKRKSLDDVLRNGDRVEIYRPLIADPKDSRRRRADKKAG